MHTLLQYLNTLNDPSGLTRTLGAFEVCRDATGRPCCRAGNSAAVFRIRHRGEFKSLRCYTRPCPNREAIYGDRLLREELYVYTSPERGEWVDVVLDDWVEGRTLDRIVAEAAASRATGALETLAATFDRLGAELVAADGAHGDLKPENLVVTPRGEIRPIDFDATFLPAFAGQQSPELGTAAYRHPARRAEDFDPSLDDYPVALISTALHALALDPTLYDRYRQRDGLLFEPCRMAIDPAFEEALALFEKHCMAIQYRIARLLLSPTLRLFGLEELLRLAAGPAAVPQTVPELYCSNGLWGFRTGDDTVIPPLYDCGFDFSEGVAAVRLGRMWHYLDTAGRPAIDASAYEAVKPFRGGRARVLRAGCRFEIDRLGREYPI